MELLYHQVHSQYNILSFNLDKKVLVSPVSPVFHKVSIGLKNIPIILYIDVLNAERQNSPFLSVQLKLVIKIFIHQNNIRSYGFDVLMHKYMKH